LSTLFVYINTRIYTTITTFTSDNERLTVSNFTYELLIVSSWKLYQRSICAQGWTGYILVVIREPFEAFNIAR